MKIPDNLYNLALGFYNTALWDKLKSSYMYAVRLNDGEVALVNISSLDGEHPSMTFFYGENGLNTFKNSFNKHIVNNELKHREAFFSADCISLYFDEEDILLEEDIINFENFLKRHLNLFSFIDDYNDLPYFQRRRPFKPPEQLSLEKEIKYLEDVLRATLSLNEALDKGDIKLDIFSEIVNGRGVIPLFEDKGTYYQISDYVIPKGRPELLPEPKLNNEILKMKLRNLKRTGTLQVDIVAIGEMVEDEKTGELYMPSTIFAVDEESGFLLPILSVGKYNKNYMDFFNDFCNYFVSAGKLPKTIKVFDAKAESFLKDFCKQLGIDLQMHDHLDLLQDVEVTFFMDSEHGLSDSLFGSNPQLLLNLLNNIAQTEDSPAIREIMGQFYNKLSEELNNAGWWEDGNSDYVDTGLIPLDELLSYLPLLDESDEEGEINFPFMNDGLDKSEDNEDDYNFFSPMLNDSPSLSGSINRKKKEEYPGSDEGTGESELLNALFEMFFQDEIIDDLDVEDEDEAYLIRVNYSKRVYREIRISEFATFRELADAVVDFFGISENRVKTYKFVLGDGEIIKGNFTDTLVEEIEDVLTFSPGEDFSLVIELNNKNVRFTGSVLSWNETDCSEPQLERSVGKNPKL